MKRSMRDVVEERDRMMRSRRRALLSICSALGAFGISAPLRAASEASEVSGKPPLQFVTHMPQSRKKGSPILFLMHGFGSDEQDVISMAPSLPPELIVVSFRAPFSNPSGGYKWFDNHDGHGHLDGDGSQIASSRQLLESAIATLVSQFEADPKRIFVGGFSQGAIMTYALTLAKPDRYRGGVVMSGAILDALNRRLDPKLTRTNLHLFVGHGTADQRIPFAYADMAAMQLRQWHVDLTFKSYPGMTHEVGAQELADVSAWISGRFRP